MYKIRPPPSGAQGDTAAFIAQRVPTGGQHIKTLNISKDAIVHHTLRLFVASLNHPFKESPPRRG